MHGKQRGERVSVKRRGTSITPRDGKSLALQVAGNEAISAKLLQRERDRHDNRTL